MARKQITSEPKDTQLPRTEDERKDAVPCAKGHYYERCKLWIKRRSGCLDCEFYTED